MKRGYSLAFQILESKAIRLSFTAAQKNLVGNVDPACNRISRQRAPFEDSAWDVRMLHRD